MRWLLLLVCLVPSVARAQWTVLPHLPVERRSDMMAALRLELAGRATVLEPDEGFDPEASVADRRDRARAAGATHAVWVTFPTGLLGPAEVRVLDLSRADAAHGMTPQAWDVVEPRVVAVLMGSLLDAASMPPSAPADPVIDVPVPAAPVASAPADAPEDTTEPRLVLPEPELDTRAARRFSLGFLTGASYRNVPGSTDEASSFVTTLTVYGRMNEWASVGLRLQGSGIGYSSIEGWLVTGLLAAPSLMVSFREPLGTVAMLELGIHAEPGLYFYGRNASQWSFGIGVGAFANLDLGVHNAITLAFTLSSFGFGDVGPQFWGALSLGYTYRWD
jgi:hypothetical protein